MPPPNVYIGTSGWHYNHWKGPFYPARMPSDRFLAFYAERFKTVELDGTFYRLPPPEVLRNWYRGTPEGFSFSMKASRYLTHMKKLHDAREPLKVFLKRADWLKEKLGPLLFQFPPWWHANPGRLREFLPLIPTDYHCTMEFRDHSWFSDEVLELLRRYRVAFCIYEIAGRCSPCHITSDWVYVRLHGPAKAYAGDYKPSVLKKWAKTIAGWRAQKKAVYMYFDNDQAGYAPKNATQLEELVNADTEAAWPQAA